MDYIDNAQLVRLIQEEGINFIGGAVTPWHAHGIDCAIRYLQDQGVRVKGIILVKAALKQGTVCHILSEKNFTTTCCRFFKSPATYNPTPLSVIQSLYREYRAPGWFNRQYSEEKERIIYLATAWHIDMYGFINLYRSLDHTYGFRLLLVEEGLSSYFPKVNTLEHRWNCFKSYKKGWPLLRSFLISALGFKLGRRFEKHTRWTNLNLLTWEGGKLKPNPLSLKYYPLVLSEYSRRISGQLPTVDPNGSVVLCTMPYDHAKIEDEEDVRVLTPVVKLIKEKGYRVYLKPHPRDTDYLNRYASLGCEFLDCPCSVETLFSVYPGIHAVVSFSSTCLVTAPLLFGIKGYSVLNLMDKNKFSFYIQEEMDSFLYCFSDIVSVPKSLEELASTI